VRIVLLSETFAKNMGYLQNALPQALARQGAEVHLVTLTLPPYYQSPKWEEIYGRFLEKEAGRPGTTEQADGVTIHYLHHKRVLGYMRMVGLFRKLREIRPDIVQTMVSIGWLALDAALAEPLLRYRLFTGSHTAASVFPLARRQAPIWDVERLKCFFTRYLPGYFVSLLAQKCYAVTPDCQDIAVRFFGVPRTKTEFCHLGVDTSVFWPASDERSRHARDQLRASLGSAPSDIVCVYTGKLSQEKNALLLAQAVARLIEEGKPFRGLFIGEGAQAKEIESSPGCRVIEFKPLRELAQFYRACDISVWPAQESISILDAAACGLPLVVFDRFKVRDCFDGNGVTYRTNDLEDLIRVLRELESPEYRSQLGRFGAEKMANEYSWDTIAKRRLNDYESALRQRRRPPTIAG